MSGPHPPEAGGQQMLSAPPPSPNERGLTEFILCVILMVIATVAVILRLVARKYKGVKFAPDDYIIVVALFFLYGNGIAGCVGVTLGGRGYHIYELGQEVIETSLKALFAAEISWTCSTSAIKISLLLLYIRLFPQKPFRLIAYILMGVVSLYCVGCMIFFVGNCRPIRANWIPMLPGSTCGNQQAGWLGTGVANLITDVAILSLPMRSVYHLQLPRRTRVAVAAIFGIGFSTLIVSIMRLVTIPQIGVKDFTYTVVPADILSAFEPTMMITCACLPIMRPLFKRFLPTNTRSKYGHGYNNDHLNLHWSKGGGRNGLRESLHMKQTKSKETSSKHKSVVLAGSDGFQRLPDIESEPHHAANVAKANEREGHDTKAVTRNSSRAFSHNRSASLLFGGKEERSHALVPPKPGIEVTTEVSVELE